MPRSADVEDILSIPLLGGSLKSPGGTEGRPTKGVIPVIMDGSPAIQVRPTVTRVDRLLGQEKGRTGFLEAQKKGLLAALFGGRAK